MSYIATEYCVSSGVGVSDKYLPSFDKALLSAGIGNYNLVRLSSILPAKCARVYAGDITEHIKEGSLLPTAYATISSNVPNERIASGIGIGFPKNRDRVAVIMEFSAKGMAKEDVNLVLKSMLEEAFEVRGWELAAMEIEAVDAVVDEAGNNCTTFACVSEW